MSAFDYAKELLECERLNIRAALSRVERVSMYAGEVPSFDQLSTLEAKAEQLKQARHILTLLPILLSEMDGPRSETEVTETVPHEIMERIRALVP